MPHIEFRWQDYKNFPLSRNTEQWVKFINGIYAAGIEIPEKMSSIQIAYPFPKQPKNIVANVLLSDQSGNQWQFQVWKLTDEPPSCWREVWNKAQISISQCSAEWAREQGFKRIENEQLALVYRIAIAQFFNQLKEKKVTLQFGMVQSSYDGKEVVAKMVNIINIYLHRTLKGELTPKGETVEYLKGSILPKNPRIHLGEKLSVFISGDYFPNGSKETLIDSLNTLKNEGVLKELLFDDSLVGKVAGNWALSFLPGRGKKQTSARFISFVDLIFTFGLSTTTRKLLQEGKQKKKLVVIQGQNLLLDAGEEVVI